MSPLSGSFKARQVVVVSKTVVFGTARAQVAAGGTARSTLVANKMGGKAHEDSRSTRVGGGSRDRAEVALEVSKTACEPATVRDQGATQLGRQGEPLIALRETVSGQLIDIVADLAAEPD